MYAYIFQGQPENTWNTFEVLDLGVKEKPSKKAKWRIFSLSEPDFLKNTGFATY